MAGFALDRRSGVDLEVFLEGKRGGGWFRQTWWGLLRMKVAGFAWSVHVAVHTNCAFIGLQHGLTSHPALTTRSCNRARGPAGSRSTSARMAFERFIEGSTS